MGPAYAIISKIMYETSQGRLNEFRERLEYIEGATGMAVAVGKKVVAIDLFDKPTTCAKVWERLLTGVVMDALEKAPTDQVAQRADVEGLLNRLRVGSWDPAPAVGEGQEFRYDADPQTHASALVFGGSVLHGSVAVAN